MKDVSPRIFRKLEKTAGRDEFDMIVTAAVASYGALRIPSESQARDFARLVMPLWERVGAETRRALAAALSNTPRVPREIVEKLLAEPVEVAAPFLIASPVLTYADLARVATRDRRISKIILGRQKAGDAAAERDAAAFADRPSALISADATLPVPPIAADAYLLGEALREPATSTATGERRRAFAPPPPLVPDLIPGAEPSREAGQPAPHPGGVTPEPPKRTASRNAAAIARDTMRRLVQPGRHPAGQTPVTLAFSDLLHLAIDGDAGSVYAGIAELLGLDDESGGRMKEDGTGERLAIALRALGASTADAMTIVMMLKPAIGYDVAAFESLAFYVKTLRPSECAALFPRRFPGKVSRPTIEGGVGAPIYAESREPRAAAQPRSPTFGRRRAKPLDIRPFKAS